MPKVTMVQHVNVQITDRQRTRSSNTERAEMRWIAMRRSPHPCPKMRPLGHHFGICNPETDLSVPIGHRRLAERLRPRNVDPQGSYCVLLPA
jgi:hypothetical protein